MDENDDLDYWVRCSTGSTDQRPPAIIAHRKDAVLGNYEPDPELANAALVASRPAMLSFAQHSREHVANARSSKDKKRSDAETRNLKAKVKEQQLALAVSSLQASAVVPLDVGHCSLNKQQLAVVDMHLACRPPVRGGKGMERLRKQQNQAIEKFSRGAVCVQKKRLREILLPPAEPPAKTQRHIDYQWQFDTASQKLRGIIGGNGHSSKYNNHGSTIQHVFNQGGRLIMTEARECGSSVEATEPNIVKGKILEDLGTNSELEAFLSACPVKYEDPAYMRLLASRCKTYRMSVCLDRASTNYCAMEYIAEVVENTCPLNVSVSMEPCGSHGCQLVKGRSSKGKIRAAGSNSFTKLLRDGKFLKLLSSKVKDNIDRQGVRITRQRRPQWHIQWAERIIAASTGQSDSFLYRVGKDGALRPTAMLVDLQNFLSCCDIPSEEAAAGIRPVCGWVHWNYAGDNSASGGYGLDEDARIDDPIAARETIDVVHQFVLGRVWCSACCSRWTHITKLKKKASYV